MTARPGARGEVFVALQLALIALVAFGPLRIAGWPATGLPASPVLGVLAIFLVAAGAFLALSGIVRLGPNLTPLAVPREEGVLVTRGIYGRVRHPIYGGLILLGFGWALWRGGGLAFGYAALLIPVLLAKSRLEEKWLMARFPEYAAYRARTRRFIPFLW
jgi:protein-S-isoprenylcysteine O-methyltransferase Ste14